MPDAFMNDPLGWAGNQSAHALVIGGGLWALLVWAGLPLAWAYGAVAAAYAVWEIVTFRGDVLDAVTDFAFVAAGCAFVWSAWAMKRDAMLLTFCGLMVAGMIGVGMRV